MKLNSLVVCAATAALAFLAPRLASAQSQRFMYAGEVDETMWVGVAIEAGRASVFLCGDEQTVDVDTQWFKGAAAVDGRWWRFDAGAWTVWTRSWLEGTLGAVARPGEPLTWWWAPRALAGAGLYREVTDDGVAGAIVFDRDGDGALELQGAFKLAATGAFIQVIPLAPVEPEDGALSVRLPPGVDEEPGPDDGAGGDDSDQPPADGELDEPADDTPADDAPADDTPADDTPADDTPADDAPADDTPADDDADGGPWIRLYELDPTGL